jgi:hypothetical protein
MVLVSVALSSAAAIADEDKDLDLIPKAAQQSASSSTPEPAASDRAQRIYLEDAVTVSSLRAEPLVPPPPPAPARWQERLLLDVRKQWSPGSRFNLTYSGRLNFRVEDGLGFPNHENVIHDFREGYASWEPLDRTYLDIGRINLKSGVAIGFNPTDFFKTRATVEPLSVDPTVLREDRLGTLMVRAQHIWDGASLTAAFAPAWYQPSPIYTNNALPSFDPMFDRTNAYNRFLLKGSADIASHFSPEFVFYSESGQTRWGANLAESVGQSVVAYAEWSGGNRASLIDDALRFGRLTGTLPPAAPSVLPESPARSFQSELSMGASYTTETKITFNLEYHYDQAAFSRTDWDNWFLAGRGHTARSPIARELWFIRDYANDEQQPISRHSVFLRADWVDALVPRLELTGFINADLHDGSGLFQLTADYYLSDRWTLGGLVTANLGARHSDFGSLPQANSLRLKVVRYF